MNKRKILSLVCAAVGVIAIGLTTTLVTLPVHASVADDIMKKTLLNAARYCMKDKFTKKEVTALDLNFSTGNINELIQDAGKKNTIYLPKDYGNSIKDSAISCQEVFNGVTSITGKTKLKGVLSLYGKQINSSTITSMGYKAEDDGLKEKCFQARYTTSTDRNYKTTNKICFTVDNEDKVVINEDHPVNIGSTPTDPGLYITYDDAIKFYLLQKLDASGSTRQVIPAGLWINVLNGDPWKDIENIENIKDIHDMPLDFTTNELVDYAELIKDSGSSTTPAVTKYVKIDELNSGNQTVKFLTNDSIKTISALQFTEKEKYDIYMNYVNKLRSDGKISIVGNESCTKKKPDSGWAIWDEDKWCEVKNMTDDYLDERYTMVRKGTPSYPGFEGGKSFGDVMAALMSLDYKDASFSDTDFSIDASGSIDTGDPEEDDEKGEYSICNNVTGLAWIVCPVVQLMSDAIEGMYDWIEGNFLEVSAMNFGTDSSKSNTAIFDGWQQFQGFANIIFVILLVLVILSQITGFGISNYGIKKALPKLIVVVILVNLSFLFCQLAVDISNILGYTLRTMFESMAEKISSDGAFHLPNVVKDGIGILGIAATATALVAATEFWKKWLPTLLLSLVGVLIGVVFFLVTLGVRQAGVLILVVISPVAIVCYALPNTKKFFDRWKSMFTSLLLVFPICGALMGGGQLAATIISSSGKALGTMVGSVMAAIPGLHFAAAADSFTGSTVMDMIAMAVQVAPFFMVPSVVRSSLNAIGNIGNRLNQMGSRLGNRASNSLGRTEAMQDFQRRMEMSRDKGLLNRMDKQLKGSDGITIRGRTFFKRAPRDLSARQNRRYAQLSKRRQAMLAEDQTAELGVGKSYIEGSEEYNTLMNRIKNEQMEKDIKAQRYNIGESEINDDTTALRKALDGHLENLKLNPDDLENKAKVYAHLDQLTAQGDTGMTQVGQAILAAVANNDLEGAQVMSRYILKNYAKQYKDKQRGTFDMAGDLSRLKLDNEAAVSQFKDKAGVNSQAKTREVLNPDGTTDTENYAFYTSEYDKKGIDSLDAQRIGDINEDTLTRYYELAMSGQLNAQQMASLSRISARALANDANGTGHVQEKLRGKLEGLANMTAGQSREFNNSFSGYVSGSDETARNDSLKRAQSTAGAMIGSAEGTSALRSNLISAGIRANQTDASGSLTQEALATRSGLVDVARDLQANHSTALAQASPEMRAMISDISANDFSHLGSTYEVATSGSGSGVPVYASTYADDGNGNMINTYYDNQTQLYGSGNGLINENTDFSNLSVEETGRLARLAQTAWDYDAGADTYSFDGVNVKAFNEQQYDRLANAISHQLKTDAKFKDPANRQQVEDLNKFLTAGDHKRINPNAERTLRDLPKLPDGYTEKSDGKFEFNLNGRTQETDVERKKLERYLEDRVDAELYNARVQQTINDETDNNPRHHH